jgi:hypothetical protein
MERFRHDKHLPALTGNPGEREKHFELFTPYCLISKHCEAEFEPAQVRTGGSYDLEVDGAAVLVGGRLYTDPDLLKDALEHLGSIGAVALRDPRRVSPSAGLSFRLPGRVR